MGPEILKHFVRYFRMRYSIGNDAGKESCHLAVGEILIKNGRHCQLRRSTRN
jgi:hypothetical protein